MKNKNQITKYKAWLVALGNHQREGQDYNETYSPVVNFVLIQLFIAILISILEWKQSLLDIKSTFLNGNVEKNI